VSTLDDVLAALEREREAGELMTALQRKQGARNGQLPATVAAGSDYAQALESSGIPERTAAPDATQASLRPHDPQTVGYQAALEWAARPENCRADNRPPMRRDREPPPRVITGRR
jgi:hypothetical protein